MTSAPSDSVNTASTMAGARVVTPTERRSTLKFKRRNVSSALPVGTVSKRYEPAPSVTAVCSPELTTRSIVTPGSAAPV
jgi:hypothetical protein